MHQIENNNFENPIDSLDHLLLMLSKHNLKLPTYYIIYNN